MDRGAGGDAPHLVPARHPVATADLPDGVERFWPPEAIGLEPPCHVGLAHSRKNGDVPARRTSSRGNGVFLQRGSRLWRALCLRQSCGQQSVNDAARRLLKSACCCSWLIIGNRYYPPVPRPHRSGCGGERARRGRMVMADFEFGPTWRDVVVGTWKRRAVVSLASSHGGQRSICSPHPFPVRHSILYG